MGLLLVVQSSEAAALILEAWLSLDAAGVDAGLARGPPGTDAGGNQGSLWTGLLSLVFCWKVQVAAVVHRNTLESTDFGVLYFWAGIKGCCALKQTIAQVIQIQGSARVTRIFLAQLLY